MLPLLLGASLVGVSHAMRPAGSAGGLEDLAAFPKYEVQFLNEFPLRASEAEQCKKEGLASDDDFLELKLRSRATIEGEASGRNNEEERSAPSLELMTMFYTPIGSDTPHSYLCALPSANRTQAQTSTASEPHDEQEPDPAASWLALSHLDGQCLYARHRWFTYAYCHNKHIRQFREAPQTQLAPPEGWMPKEDPGYDSYTLGLAHPQKRKGSLGQRKKDKEDSHALAPERTATFGVGPASRYLVQRWTDGTRCDKTGAPREVEVQVHCSMTSGDSIYMVKEIEICKYVVVIHSPHLCSLPGFRPQTADDIEPVPIRCREVVSDEEFARWETEPEEKRQKTDVLRLPGQEPVEPKFKLKEGGVNDLEVDESLIERLQKVLGSAFGEAGIDVKVLSVGENGERAKIPESKEEGDEDKEYVLINLDHPDGSGEDYRKGLMERLQEKLTGELGDGAKGSAGKKTGDRKEVDTSEEEANLHFVNFDNPDAGDSPARQALLKRLRKMVSGEDDEPEADTNKADEEEDKSEYVYIPLDGPEAGGGGAIRQALLERLQKMVAGQVDDAEDDAKGADSKAKEEEPEEEDMSEYVYIPLDGPEAGGGGAMRQALLERLQKMVAGQLDEAEEDDEGVRRDEL